PPPPLIVSLPPRPQITSLPGVPLSVSAPSVAPGSRVYPGGGLLQTGALGGESTVTATAGEALSSQTAPETASSSAGAALRRPVRLVAPAATSPRCGAELPGRTNKRFPSSPLLGALSATGCATS